MPERLSDERVAEIAGGGTQPLPPHPCNGNPNASPVECIGWLLHETINERAALASEVRVLRAAMAWLDENTLCIGTCASAPEVDREAWWLVMQVTEDPPDFRAALAQAMAAPPPAPAREP